MTIFSVVAALGAVYLIAQGVMTYIARKEMTVLKIRNDLRQQAYLAQIKKTTEELENAKIQYANDLSKLNDAIGNSEPGLPKDN